MPFSQFDEAGLRQLLQQFFNSSFNAIVITSAEPGYPIVYANPEFCRMTGYDLDELLGKSPKIFQGEKTNRRILARLKADIEAGRFFHGATTNYRKDGEPYPVEWNISPIKDTDGSITHYLSIQKDLSGLRRIVSRLKTTNEHFRGFLVDIAAAVESGAAEGLKQTLATEKPAIVDELLDNSKLYTPALRSDQAIDLFDDNEFFDCSNDTNGMFSDAAQEKEEISAREYCARHPAYADMGALSSIIEETLAHIDLLVYRENAGGEMAEIGQNLHDIANEVFAFDDFVDMASVLSELATYTRAHEGEAVEPFVVETFSALLTDLQTWLNSVFIEKSAANIHELDASIISSARQLLMFLK